MKKRGVFTGGRHQITGEDLTYSGRFLKVGVALIDIVTIGQATAGLRLILSLGAGYAVSKVAGKYILTNSEGKVIGEYEVGSNGGNKVSSFADLMSSEDAEVYNKWMDLRAAGYDIPVDDYIKICLNCLMYRH